MTIWIAKVSSSQARWSREIAYSNWRLPKMMTVISCIPCPLGSQVALTTPSLQHRKRFRIKFKSIGCSVSVSESQGWNAVYRTHCQQSAISLLLKLLVESYSFAVLRIATKSLSFSFGWDFSISNTRTQAFWASFLWQTASDLLRHPELIPWPSQATVYSYLIFDTHKQPSLAYLHCEQLSSTPSARLS
jgi:hypothetical protein